MLSNIVSFEGCGTILCFIGPKCPEMAEIWKMNTNL
jgi:hypothetical protein